MLRTEQYERMYMNCALNDIRSRHESGKNDTDDSKSSLMGNFLTITSETMALIESPNPSFNETRGRSATIVEGWIPHRMGSDPCSRPIRLDSHSGRLTTVFIPFLRHSTIKNERFRVEVVESITLRIKLFIIRSKMATYIQSHITMGNHIQSQTPRT
jgi:hypothetical protein